MCPGRVGGLLCRCAVGIGGGRVVSHAPCHCDLREACLRGVCLVSLGRGDWREGVFCSGDAVPLGFVRSTRIVSGPFMSCHVMSCHVMPCRVVSCRHVVMLFNVMSCYVASGSFMSLTRVVALLKSRCHWSHATRSEDFCACHVRVAETNAGRRSFCLPPTWTSPNSSIAAVRIGCACS